MVTIRPGIHRNITDDVIYNTFTLDEIEIINKIAGEWYITKTGKIRLTDRSKYSYILIKPTPVYIDMFNLEKELGVVFSNYSNLDIRTFDCFDKLIESHATWRVEKICGVLISKDENADEIVSNYIKSDPEERILISFSYNNFNKQNFNSYTMRNKFRRFFYKRDLFSFEAPLKKDIFFFGRKDLIYNIINRHKSNENSGLFGLRKTGKTSVIYGIKRALRGENYPPPIIIDCQDTSFNQNRWYEALYYICQKILEVIILKDNKIDKRIKLLNINNFTNKNASYTTEKFFKMSKTIYKKPLFIIFDEIENISIKTSPVEHWRNDNDFIFFWQSLRSIFQRNTDLLSYLIVGTNPYCLEKSTINNADNPIFNHLKPEYIPGFQVIDTREMVRKLGRRMGLKFDDIIYSRLTEDVGGHPFLIRRICSIINDIVIEYERPVNIDIEIYDEAKKIFRRNYNEYLYMILNVLKSYYKIEYEMLEYLAIGDYKTVKEFFDIDPSILNHLIGYGVISSNKDRFDFKIDIIREYFVDKKKLLLSNNNKKNCSKNNIIESNYSYSKQMKIFISYCRNDSEYLERLKIHLKYFDKKGMITCWDDSEIKPGMKWKEEITKALNDVDVAILLVSADFLASDFILEKELPPILLAAKKKGTTILAITVKPCVLSGSELVNFQFVNSLSDPLSGKTEHEREIVYSKIVNCIIEKHKNLDQSNKINL